MVKLKILQFFVICFIKKEEDNNNFCFICQINKNDYEKNGKNFRKHVNKEHNLWNYANFIMSLKNKSEKDYAGLESEIFQKIAKGDLSWFPHAKESI